MDPLPRSEHRAALLPPEPPDASNRVLLVDSDDRRRNLRAQALMSRGVVVDGAAETRVARILWKPGAYGLVLIDLRGADADCASFITFVQDERCDQRFGFYLAQPPYVTSSASECRSSMQQQKAQRPAPGAPPPPAPVDGRNGTGLIAAATRIASLRQAARIRAQARQAPSASELRDDPSREVQVSQALRLAGRILGGS